MADCAICQEINVFERQLDIRARKLTQRVIDLCRPARERNNARWAAFANLCNAPLVGRFLQRRMGGPKGLESENFPFEESWYREAGRRIEADARALEARKGAHLEHWGDEIVHPKDISDPGGYYTSSRCLRSDCYAHGFVPFVPDKFDFSSGAGVDKLYEGKLVMCSATRKLVALNDCDVRCGGKGAGYYSRGMASQADPTIPGFGEWRNDAQVSAAGSRARMKGIQGGKIAWNLWM